MLPLLPLVTKPSSNNGNCRIACVLEGRARRLRFGRRQRNGGQRALKCSNSYTLHLNRWKNMDIMY
jgi:hypothetical protein